MEIYELILYGVLYILWVRTMYSVMYYISYKKFPEKFLEIDSKFILCTTISSMLIDTTPFKSSDVCVFAVILVSTLIIPTFLMIIDKELLFY